MDHVQSDRIDLDGDSITVVLWIKEHDSPMHPVLRRSTRVLCSGMRYIFFVLMSFKMLTKKWIIFANATCSLWKSFWTEDISLRRAHLLQARAAGVSFIWLWWLWHSSQPKEKAIYKNIAKFLTQKVNPNKNWSNWWYNYLYMPDSYCL